MTSATTYPSVAEPTTLEDAHRLLTEQAVPFAGGTWIMRAQHRGERHHHSYVSLRRIAELCTITETDRQITIGACVTHQQLIDHSYGSRALGAVCEAARMSGFPAVRNVATVGGNICASPYASADVVPALLACEASVVVWDGEAVQTTNLDEYLQERHGLLIERILMPTPPTRRSWYVRLSVRGGAAESAVAAVALSVDFTDRGRVAGCRIAVGSVEEGPRRLYGAEEALRETMLDDDAVAAAASRAADEVEPREDRDAPGWYRRAVLPGLVRRAVQLVRNEERHDDDT